jgi:hypothetical protein
VSLARKSRRRTTSPLPLSAASSRRATVCSQAPDPFSIQRAVNLTALELAPCRDILWTQLNAICDRVANLRKATSSAAGQFDLADVLQASEAARIASLQALTEQYQRIAAGRPIPNELPVPKPRSRQDGQIRIESRPPPEHDDDDRLTIAMTISSGPLRFQSEPPSPPPTPKNVPDDLESTWAGSEAGGPGILLRPNNSVFSIFCPDAMSLQVNLRKATPDKRKCRCGYRWKPTLPDKKDVVLLKEGFRMTARFLAKSHCDKDDYGCVLCTSTGRTDTYESAEALGVHINASHTKWQMLHDRDMA